MKILHACRLFDQAEVFDFELISWQSKSSAQHLLLDERNAPS